MTQTAQLFSTKTRPMTQRSQLFTSSIKMLVRDKTAFLRWTVWDSFQTSQNY